MSWLISAGGAVVVAIVLRDIFHTLWHPQGFGPLTQVAARTVWRMSKALTPRRGSELAGPLGMLMAVTVWTLGSVIGWALVYLPWMPHGFYFGTSLKPEASSDILSSLYLSVVTLATLGFGDITPAAPALRLITPVEALIGFVLLTAAISWVLQVYPALGRRRAFASELSIMAASDARDVVEHGEAHVATSLLHPLTRSLIGVTVDLTQYAESYYFWESTTRMSLPANLPVILELILASRRSPHSEVHQAGAALERGADDLAEQLSTFVRRASEGASAARIFAAYARDHRQHRVDP